VADVGQVAPAAIQQEIGGVVLSYDVKQLYYQSESTIKLEDRLYCIQSAKEFKLQPVENYLIKLKFDPLLTLSSGDRMQEIKRPLTESRKSATTLKRKFDLVFFSLVLEFNCLPPFTSCPGVFVYMQNSNSSDKVSDFPNPGGSGNLVRTCSDRSPK